MDSFVWFLLLGVLALLVLISLIRRGANQYLDLVHGYAESPTSTEEHAALRRRTDPGSEGHPHKASD